jgi:hypothetical protein
MTGFRSNIKRIAQRGLLALLFVATPAVTGLHAAAAEAAPSIPPRQPLADTASAGDLAAFSQASGPRLSDGSESSRRRGDECTICSAFATANAILFAPPPLLLLPQVIEFLHQATDAEFVHLKSMGLSSRRRAPPTS